ncbi:MAG: HAMP domain-containing histidine kinase [Bacteroidetes bacterium]|mgnify:CR=1 FL=1|nr:HAMP domain-containing histidine kinase [Bacteroidota bacterium]
MIRRNQWRLLFRITILLISFIVTAYLAVSGLWMYELIMIPLIIYLVYDFWRFNKNIQDEVKQFVENIHYRDFTRSFNVQSSPLELQPLRKSFNEINDAFKTISNEKETQSQYLQKILELVNTGIISYEEESGEVMWMNESLKKLLQLPYLKTIHSLSKRDWKLYHEVMSLPLGKVTIGTAHVDADTFKVLLSATAFQTGEKRYKLIAFQNVNDALDETENKAWQKLLSVMTHEIMNSVAPIVSLADTLGTQVRNTHIESIKGENGKEDLELGIETIKRRSEGLLRFAETYRNLNKITTLTLTRMYAADIFENLLHLMQPMLKQKNIESEIILNDPSLAIEADINLLEQVLINLVVNAMEAVKESLNPKITFTAYRNQLGHTIIKIADNGAGIPEELIDQIFVPFFSTRKNGSGIGLSLCKQIMLLHKGSISVHSVVGKGTAFTLQF